MLWRGQPFCTKITLRAATEPAWPLNVPIRSIPDMKRSGARGSIGSDGTQQDATCRILVEFRGSAKHGFPHSLGVSSTLLRLPQSLLCSPRRIALLNVSSTSKRSATTTPNSALRMSVLPRSCQTPTAPPPTGRPIMAAAVLERPRMVAKTPEPSCLGKRPGYALLLEARVLT